MMKPLYEVREREEGEGNFTELSEILKNYFIFRFNILIHIG